MAKKPVYQPGRVRIIQRTERIGNHCIYDERFETDVDLKKLLFFFKGISTEAIVIFDEPKEEDESKTINYK